MEKKEFYYDSRDGLTKIHAVEWLPGGRPVCILQIVHGMAEYIDRYHRLAVFLAEKGILVVGNDHLEMCIRDRKKPGNQSKIRVKTQ